MGTSALFLTQVEDIVNCKDQAGAATGIPDLSAVTTGVPESCMTMAFPAYGTALGFGAFVVIVLTVVQLVFRLMRVTLSEWLGDAWVGFKNPHIAAIVSMVLTLGLVMSGTWIYLWQLFGASNQLMAALSLLIVTLWLRSTGRDPSYALYPMIFMYVTTMAGTLVTAYNLYASILSNPRIAAQPINLVGAVAMILVALLLFGAALVIAYDAWGAWQKIRARPLRAAPAEAGD